MTALIGAVLTIVVPAPGRLGSCSAPLRPSSSPQCFQFVDERPIHLVSSAIVTTRLSAG